VRVADQGEASRAWGAVRASKGRAGIDKITLASAEDPGDDATPGTLDVYACLGCCSPGVVY